jgi:pheromone a factor receptor
MDNTTSANPFNFQDYFVVDPISGQAIALPIFCLIAILINIIPFLALSSGSRINISACSLIIYIFLANLFTLINSLLWPTNDYANWFSGIGLCDIETKLQLPIITGIAAATACLTRELAEALDTKSAKVTSTRRDRRNKIIIDSLLCFALPTLQIILHWLVQDVRFFLAVLAGCGASYDASWPTVVIMYIWPVIFSLLSCIYSG